MKAIRAKNAQIVASGNIIKREENCILTCCCSCCWLTCSDPMCAMSYRFLLLWAGDSPRGWLINNVNKYCLLISRWKFLGKVQTRKLESMLTNDRQKSLFLSARAPSVDLQRHDLIKLLASSHLSISLWFALK